MEESILKEGDPVRPQGQAEELEAGPRQTSSKLKSLTIPQIRREVVGDDVGLLRSLSLQTTFLASLSRGFLWRG